MKRKKKTSSIVSMDPYNGSSYGLVTNQLQSIKQPKSQKNQYVISYLGNKDFLTTIISIGKNIPEEDIADIIENKTYSELNLDMATEYTIEYTPVLKNASGEEQDFHVFAVDPEIIKERFAHVAERVTYIDKIVPIPLLFKGLYQREIISESGIHVFIYFQRDDAFLSIYRDYEFLYVKSLDFSLLQMHETYSRLANSKIGSEEEFITLLASMGLNQSDSYVQQHIMKLFGDIFTHINDILTFIKRAFDIATIDKIYIGSEIGPIVGVDEYCQTYMALPAQNLNFNFGFETQEKHIDQLHALMHIDTLLNYDEKYNLNFTLFSPPPPFAKRQSGKFILVTAASTLIALAYPTFNYSFNYFKTMQLENLRKEYSATHSKKISRETLKNKRAKELKMAKELLSIEEKLFYEKSKMLKEVYDEKINYSMKAKILTNLSQNLTKYRISLTKVTYTENENRMLFTLSMLAKKEKMITDLIKLLTNEYTKEYNVGMKKIEFDKKLGAYRSDVEVFLR